MTTIVEHYLHSRRAHGIKLINLDSTIVRENIKKIEKGMERDIGRREGWRET